MSDSENPWAEPTRLLWPWDFPGKNTEVGCYFLFQGIFLTQGSDPSLLNCRQTLYHLSHQGSQEVSKRGLWRKTKRKKNKFVLVEQRANSANKTSVVPSYHGYFYFEVRFPPSLTAQLVENPPAMQETPVQSLGREDPPEKGMATNSSILPREFHGQRNLAGYSPWGPKESDTTERLNWTEQLNDKWRWATNIFYLHLGLADSQRERATESRTGAREKRWSVESWLTQGKACWSRARVDP